MCKSERNKMNRVFIGLLFLVMSCAAQFQSADYRISHLPNPPAEQVTIYHYWYEENNNPANFQLKDNMTYEQAMALPGALNDLVMTITDTLIYGTIPLQENGFWHIVGGIAENARGQRSLMAISTPQIKQEILVNLTKMREMRLDKLF